MLRLSLFYIVAAFLVFPFLAALEELSLPLRNRRLFILTATLSALFPEIIFTALENGVVRPYLFQPGRKFNKANQRKADRT